MRKVIQFDVDGVLADFVLGFTKLAHEMYGCPITDTKGQPNWDGFPGMDRKQINGVWDRLKHDCCFWSNLTPLVSEEEWAIIENLYYKDYDLYFVTSRVGDDPKWQTEKWLQDYGIHNPTVIISSCKGEVASAINATHSIEDKAGNAICIQHMSKATSYILDQPYNRFPHETVGTKVKRVNTVEEFLKDLERDEA